MATVQRPTTRKPARWRGAAALTAALVLLAGAGVANADELEELEQQRRDNAAEQERLTSELEGTDAALQTVYLEITRLDGEIPIAESELAQAEADLAAAERHQSSVADRLAVAQTEAATLESDIATSAQAIDQTHDDIGELARSTYRGSEGFSAIAVVVDATTPEDFLQRATAVTSAMRTQSQVLDDLEVEAAVQRNSQLRLDAVNVRIGELKVEADEAVVVADDARAEAQDRRDELAALRVERTNRAGELEDLKGNLEQQQADIASDNADLAAQIDAIYKAREEEARKERERLAAAEAKRLEDLAKQQAASGNGGSGGNGGGGSAPAPAPAPAPSGGVSLVPTVPSPFYVTSPYGMRIYPITGGRYMHYGTDIRSACGNPQFSAASGTVSAVRGAVGNGTHGNQVIIDHGVINGDSYVTVYNHLSRFNVSVGQSIGAGDVLGYTGMTGAVTGCHVHVEVWKNGSTIDPESLPGWDRTN